jgi:hypothetical protein
MGADPRVDDARWLLDWVNRTDRTQFSRRDAHAAAPRGRFPKAADLEPALRLLEEHGYLRRVDPEPSRDPHGRGRPASPRFLVNPSPRATETTQTTNTPPRHPGQLPMNPRTPVTLSNENGPSRSRPCQEPNRAASAGQRPAPAPSRPIWSPAGPWLIPLGRPKR